MCILENMQLLCSCLKVCIWEAWKEVVTTELNWNRTERLNSIWNISSQKTLWECKTVESTDVLGSTAELKRSWRCLEEDNQLYQMAPSLLVHPSGWPVQSSEDLMDHLWLRVEERGNLPAVLHPEYRRAVNEDSHGQNRQKGHRVEELAAELASEWLILVLCSSCVHQEVAPSHFFSLLKWWKAQNHCKKLKSPRQG